MPRTLQGIFLVSSFLLLFAANSTSAMLVGPLNYLNSSVAVPTGIASYGLYNISNDSGPYQIQTNSIVGFSQINSIQAYNASPPENTSTYGATLQLNVVLNITATNGGHYSYWIQDVADLNTSNMTYAIGDNIWNMTRVNGSVINTTIISGLGSTAPTGQGLTTFYVYFPNTTNSYGYPLYFIPVINVKLADGHPVVQIGYKVDGSYVFYDNVTFNITAENAYLLVTPYYLTPAPVGGSAIGNFYDAEMILGGEGSGEASQFTNTNVVLWIGYLNNGTLTPFPTVGSFGSDTEETGHGLSVGPSGGDALVTTGQLNYNETVSLYGIPSMLGTENISGSSTSTIVASTTTMPTSQPANNTSNYTTTTVSNETSGNSGASSNIIQNILNAIENFFSDLFGHL